jgi:predicted nucleic acid-binding protein
MKLKPSEKMQKIVIDTNVLVSSLIQRGYSNKIINEFFIE